MSTQALSNDAFTDALQRARKIAAKMGEEKGTKRLADEENDIDKRSAAVNDPALQQQKALQGKTLVSEEYQVPDKMGGENIVKIQRETGVLSVQFAQDSGGMPDRKCTITGPPQSIDKAKEMIDQMIEKAKSALIPAPGAPIAPEDETIVSVGIPSDKVGLVIGKSGENIKKLQEEAGVRMVMIQDGIYANAPEKELRIMGDPERIERAKELVAELLAQHGYTFDNNDYTTQVQGPYVTREQIIPKCAIGLIIGKNGETIKRIMMDSGARIRFKEGDINPQGDRILIVAGGQNQIETAFVSINSYVQTAQMNYERTFGSRGIVNTLGGTPDPSSSYTQQQEVHIMIPTNKCGLVIGKGGENVKNISVLTGAHVELDRRVNTDPNSPEKAFVIKGTHSQVTHAAQLVCEKADIPVPSIPVPPPQNALAGNAAAALAAYGYPGMGTANPYGQTWGSSYNQWGSNDPSKQTSSTAGSAGSSATDVAAAWTAYYQQYYAQAAAAAAAGSAGGASAGQHGGQAGGAYGQGANANTAPQQGCGGHHPQQQAQQQQQHHQGASQQQNQHHNSSVVSGGAAPAYNQDFTAAWAAYYQQMAMQQPKA